MIFNLPAGLAPGKSGDVAVRLRCAGSGPAATIRMLGVDAKNRIILQRRAEPRAGGSDAQRRALPWTRWRIGATRAAADRARCRHLELRIEQGPGELQLDDLRLTDPAGADEKPADWLRRVAFGGRDIPRAEADGLLVATDAPDQLSDADLARYSAGIRTIRAIVRRLFAGEVRPVEGSTPPSLLISASTSTSSGFLRPRARSGTSASSRRRPRA